PSAGSPANGSRQTVINRRTDVRRDRRLPGGPGAMGDGTSPSYVRINRRLIRTFAGVVCRRTTRLRDAGAETIDLNQRAHPAFPPAAGSAMIELCRPGAKTETPPLLLEENVREARGLQ